VNVAVAGGFGGVLVVVGVLGFVVPPKRALTSGAPAYNVFHLTFGVLGIVIALGGSDAAARAFNIGFGAIDLYQAAASRRGWFPRRWFRWTRVDDVLHVVIGIALVAVGVVG
jgi:hypothetical protein